MSHGATAVKETPLFTIVNWLAVVTVIAAAALTSFDITPYNQICFFTGNTLWMIMAVRWKQWSLFTVNFIMNVFYLYGFLS